MIPTVFEYLDYRRFLADFYHSQKKTKPYFSHRFFCRKAGFKTSNVLKLVIEGKRNLTRTSISQFAKAIGFAQDEKDYFECLVLFNQAKTTEQKEAYLRRLLDMKKKGNIKDVAWQQYEFYKDWYHTLVREMVELPGFDQTAEWIAKRMWPPIDPKQVSESLKLLEQLGFIQKNKRNQWQVADPAITTPAEVESEYVANFNRAMIRHALQASLSYKKSQREISGLTLRISQMCFEQIKQKIVDFKKELLGMALLDEKSDRVYQLNFQLFPLMRE